MDWHHLHDYFFPHRRNKHRPHIFSYTSIAILVLAVVLLEAGYLAQTKFVFFKTNFLASVLPGALVALTNQDRMTSGLNNVTEDLLLDAAAQAAANDMAARGYFSHVSPDGKDPWYWLNSVGYAYSYAGQNLAVNFSDSENVETAWMASPTHRANIEKPQYTNIGIGTANGIYEGKETTFVVSFFATPAVSAEVRPPQKLSVAVESPQQTNASSSRVLGSQDVSALPVSPTSATPGWFVSLLASPFTTLETILTILFCIIAISFTSAIFMRGRMQHPTVVIGGIFLFLLIAGALLLSTFITGPVLVSVI